MIRFIVNFVRDCRTLVVPLLTLMLLTAVMVAAGAGSAAVIVSNLGTMLILAANVAYIAVLVRRDRRRGGLQ